MNSRSARASRFDLVEEPLCLGVVDMPCRDHGVRRRRASGNRPGGPGRRSGSHGVPDVGARAVREVGQPDVSAHVEQPTTRRGAVAPERDDRVGDASRLSARSGRSTTNVRQSLSVRHTRPPGRSTRSISADRGLHVGEPLAARARSGTRRTTASGSSIASASADAERHLDAVARRTLAGDGEHRLARVDADDASGGSDERRRTLRATSPSPHPTSSSESPDADGEVLTLPGPEPENRRPLRRDLHGRRRGPTGRAASSTAFEARAGRSRPCHARSRRSTARHATR